jgi:hypothetical protein
MSSASMTAARALISGLPREELQNLAKEIQTLMTTAPKEKRVAAVGQKAWFAFMRHCRDTMAERFTTCKSAPDYAVVCKAIRQEDEAVYTAFVEKFKAENSAPTSDAEVSSAKPAPVAKPVAKSAEKEQKAAAKSAEKAAAKSAEKEQKSAEKAAKKEAVRLAKEGAYLAKEAEKEAAKQQKVAAKEAAKQQKAAEKEAAKLAKLAAKPAKGTKATKAKPATAPISAEATPAPAEAEEDAMPKITIEGTAYWHDESTNGLYSIDDAGGFGDWVGYYQPDNEEEPIRYTATPE